MMAAMLADSLVAYLAGWLVGLSADCSVANWAVRMGGTLADMRVALKVGLRAA